MARAIIHTSVHLQPEDRATVGQGGSTLWVELDSRGGPASGQVSVYPYSADQADAIALAFQEAAQRLREQAAK